MTTKSEPGIGRLAGSILGLVLLATPFAAYLWHTLNDLLSGHVRPVRLLLAIPVLLVFAGLLLVIARFVRSTETGDRERVL